MTKLQTRTEVLFISSGWLWTYALAALNTPQGGVRMAIATIGALVASLMFRRTVLSFFRVELSELGDGITQAYLWAIFAFVTGLTLAAYALLTSVPWGLIP